MIRWLALVRQRYSRVKSLQKTVSGIFFRNFQSSFRACRCTLGFAGCGLDLSSAVDAAGNIYIADICYSRIRKVSPGIFTTVAGNGKLADGATGTAPASR